MKKPFDLDSYILHHIADSQEWHLPFLPTIYLPDGFSLHALMLVIGALIMIGLFVGLYDKKSFIPTRVTNLLEVFILFIRDEISIKNLGEDDGKRLTPFFCTLFFFIL